MLIKRTLVATLLCTTMLSGCKEDAAKPEAAASTFGTPQTEVKPTGGALATPERQKPEVDATAVPLVVLAGTSPEAPKPKEQEATGVQTFESKAEPAASEVPAEAATKIEPAATPAPEVPDVATLPPLPVTPNADKGTAKVEPASPELQTPNVVASLPAVAGAEDEAPKIPAIVDTERPAPAPGAEAEAPASTPTLVPTAVAIEPAAPEPEVPDVATLPSLPVTPNADKGTAKVEPASPELQTPNVTASLPTAPGAEAEAPASKPTLVQTAVAIEPAAPKAEAPDVVTSPSLPVTPNADKGTAKVEPASPELQTPNVTASLPTVPGVEA
ncbi:hypothetical protein M8997_008670, partial [Phyllobacterium sp. 21LDTY02-6]|uniref:hypothetical protein n=1 Tax=Phyllobacterium sp. 21LDTY02-6 TaxID=2944903 RepID=UPI003531F6ED|nr:hypothetical protein [Phyllobacterium sp. 21LDTY02-6]